MTSHFAASHIHIYLLYKQPQRTFIMNHSPEITSLEIYEPLPLPLVATSEEFDEVINALDSESIVDTASLVKSSSYLSLDLKRSLLFEPAYAPPPPPSRKPAQLNLNQKLKRELNQKLKQEVSSADNRRDSIYTIVLKKRYSQIRGSLKLGRTQLPPTAKPRLERALTALPHALSRLSIKPRKRLPNRT